MQNLAHNVREFMRSMKYLIWSSTIFHLRKQVQRGEITCQRLYCVFIAVLILRLYLE